MGGSWASGAWKRICQSSRSQHTSQKTDGTGILHPSCRDCCHSTSCDGCATEYDIECVCCRLYATCLLEGQHHKLNPSCYVEMFAVSKIPMLMQNSIEALDMCSFNNSAGLWSTSGQWAVYPLDGFF